MITATNINIFLLVILLNAVSSAAGEMIVSGVPSSVPAGSVMTVTVRDSVNAPSSALSVVATQGQTEVAQATCAQGPYRWECSVSLPTAGPVSLSFKKGGSSVASATTTVVAGPPSATTSSFIGTAPGTVAAGTPVAMQFLVVDATGNAVSGASIKVDVTVGGATVPSSVVSLSGGKFNIQYTPSRIGLYEAKVSVMVGSSFAPVAPTQKATVVAGPLAASRCTFDTQEKIATAGTTATVVVRGSDSLNNVRDLGLATVTATLSMASGTPGVADSTVPVTVSGANLSFRSTKSGLWKLSVQVDGQEIQGSPLSVRVKSGPSVPTKSQAVGYALKGGKSGVLQTFKVYVYDDFGNLVDNSNDVITVALRPSSESSGAAVTPSAPGVYSVAFTPASNLASITVSVGGTAIHDPYPVTFRASTADLGAFFPGSSEVVPGSARLQIYAGETAEVRVQAISASQLALPNSVGTTAIQCALKSRATQASFPCSVTDTNNGEYKVTASLTVSGPYTLAITGTAPDGSASPISGSPFENLVVVPSATDASKSTVSMLGTSVVAGTPFTMFLDRKDRHGNTQVTLRQDDVVATATETTTGATVALKYTEASNNRLVFKGTPTSVGKYSVTVLINGALYGGRVSFIDVTAGAASVPHFTCNGETYVTAGTEGSLRCRESDAFGNARCQLDTPLSAVVSDPTVCSVNAASVVSGCEWVVFWSCRKSGSHTISIGTGSAGSFVNVKGSPFNMVVGATVPQTSKCTANPPSSVVAGSISEFTITPRDEFSNLVSATGLIFSAYAVPTDGGVRSVATVVERNGVYTAALAVGTTGAHQIVVTRGGEHIQGSPFSATVSAGPAVSLAAVSTALGVSDGWGATLILTGVDAAGNTGAVQAGTFSARLAVAGQDFRPVTYLASSKTFSFEVTGLAALGPVQFDIKHCLNGNCVDRASVNVVVTAGLPNRIAVPESAPVRAGVPKIAEVVLTDSLGNVAALPTSWSAAATCTHPSAGPQTFSPLASSSATVSFFLSLTTVGGWTCTFTVGPSLSKQATFTVSAGEVSPSHSSVTATPSGNVVAGSTVQLAVVSRDMYGNNVDGAVSCKVTAPDSVPAEVTLTNGAAQVATTSAGSYRVDCLASGNPIKHSPVTFDASVSSVSKTVVYGALASGSKFGTKACAIIALTDNFGNTIPIDSTDAVVVTGSPLTVGGTAVVWSSALQSTVSGGRMTTCWTALTDPSRDSYSVTFSVTRSGTTLTTFTPTFSSSMGASDAAKSGVIGSLRGSAGQTMAITVVARNAAGQQKDGSQDLNNIAATVTNPKGANVAASVAAGAEGGTYTVSFTSNVAGDHSVSIKLGGTAIGSGSALTVTLTPGATSSVQVSCNDCSTDECICQLSSVDSLGNVFHGISKGYTLSASLAGSSTPVTFRDTGSYILVVLVPGTVGEHTLTVNSQTFKIDVAGGRAVASRTVLGEVAATVPAGSTLTVPVDARDAANNVVTNGRAQIVSCRLESLAATYTSTASFAQGFTCTFNPLVTGEYTVRVSVDGLESSSTATVTVTAGLPSGSSTASGAGITRAAADTPTEVCVEFKDAQGNIVSVVDSSLLSVAVPTCSVGPTYTAAGKACARYVCQAAGSSVSVSVTVKTANGVQQVSGSPFSVPVVAAAGPAVISARLSSTGTSVAVTFDTATNTVLGSDAGFDCAGLLSCGATAMATLVGGSKQCVWSSSSVLSIRLGFTATLPVDARCTILESAGLTNAQGNSASSTAAFFVEAPLDPVKPQAVIVATQEINKCDTLNVDGTGSTGGAGRALSYSWRALFESQGVDETAVVVAVAESSTLPLFHIAPALLKAGMAMSFELTVTSWLNQRSTITHKVKVSPILVPIMKISGSTAIAVSGGGSHALVGEANVPCGDRTATDIAYAWTAAVLRPDGSEGAQLDLTKSTVADQRTVNSRELVFFGSALTVGTSYVFRLSGTLGVGTGVAAATVTRVAAPITCVAPGDKTVSSGTTVALDFGRGSDPDGLDAFPFAYRISCTFEPEYATSAVDNKPCGTTVASTLYNAIDSGYVNFAAQPMGTTYGTYVFTAVLAKEPNSRSCTAVSRIKVVAPSSSSLTVGAKCDAITDPSRPAQCVASGSLAVSAATPAGRRLLAEGKRGESSANPAASCADYGNVDGAAFVTGVDQSDVYRVTCVKDTKGSAPWQLLANLADAPGSDDIPNHPATFAAGFGKIGDGKFATGRDVTEIVASKSVSAAVGVERLRQLLASAPAGSAVHLKVCRNAGTDVDTDCVDTESGSLATNNIPAEAYSNGAPSYSYGQLRMFLPSASSAAGTLTNGAKLPHKFWAMYFRVLGMNTGGRPGFSKYGSGFCFGSGNSNVCEQPAGTKVCGVAASAGCAWGDSNSCNAYFSTTRELEFCKNGKPSTGVLGLRVYAKVAAPAASNKASRTVQNWQWSVVSGALRRAYTIPAGVFFNIPAGLLSSGATYVFRATGSLEGATGSRDVKVVVNDLPSNGRCSVSPSVGTELITIFTLECTGWEDKDGIASYSWFASCDGAASRPISNSDATSKKRVRLQRCATSSQIKLSAIVEDDIGGKTSVDVAVTVNAMTASSVARSSRVRAAGDGIESPASGCADIKGTGYFDILTGGNDDEAVVQKVYCDNGWQMYANVYDTVGDDIPQGSQASKLGIMSGWGVTDTAQPLNGFKFFETGTQVTELKKGTRTAVEPLKFLLNWMNHYDDNFDIKMCMLSSEDGGESDNHCIDTESNTLLPFPATFEPKDAPWGKDSYNGQSHRYLVSSFNSRVWTLYRLLGLGAGVWDSQGETTNFAIDSRNCLNFRSKNNPLASEESLCEAVSTGCPTNGQDGPAAWAGSRSGLQYRPWNTKDDEITTCNLQNLDNLVNSKIKGFRLYIKFPKSTCGLDKLAAQVQKACLKDEKALGTTLSWSNCVGLASKKLAQLRKHAKATCSSARGASGGRRLLSASGASTLTEHDKQQLSQIDKSFSTEGEEAVGAFSNPGVTCADVEVVGSSDSFVTWPGAASAVKVTCVDHWQLVAQLKDGGAKDFPWPVGPTKMFKKFPEIWLQGHCADANFKQCSSLTTSGGSGFMGLDTIRRLQDSGAPLEAVRFCVTIGGSESCDDTLSTLSVLNPALSAGASKAWKNIDKIGAGQDLQSLYYTLARLMGAASTVLPTEESSDTTASQCISSSFGSICERGADAWVVLNAAGACVAGFNVHNTAELKCGASSFRVYAKFAPSASSGDSSDDAIALVSAAREVLSSASPNQQQTTTAAGGLLGSLTGSVQDAQSKIKMAQMCKGFKPDNSTVGSLLTCAEKTSASGSTSGTDSSAGRRRRRLLSMTGLSQQARVGSFGNPAENCAHISAEDQVKFGPNFWVRAPKTNRVFNDGSLYMDGREKLDRVYVTCRTGGYQLVAQMIDTEGDDWPESSAAGNAGFKRTVRLVDGKPLIMEAKPWFAALTVDEHGVSGRFDPIDEVNIWAHHPFKPDFRPDVMFCLVDRTVTDGDTITDVETCSHTAGPEHSKLEFRTLDSVSEANPYRRLTLNDDFTATYQTTVGAGTRGWVKTWASYQSKAGEVNTPFASGNCLDVTATAEAGFGNAGKMCEEADLSKVADCPTNPPGSEPCTWFFRGNSTGGNVPIPGQCFRPWRSAQDELWSCQSGAPVTNGKRYRGWRTYAKFWDPSSVTKEQAEERRQMMLDLSNALSNDKTENATAFQGETMTVSTGKILPGASSGAVALPNDIGSSLSGCSGMTYIGYSADTPDMFPDSDAIVLGGSASLEVRACGEQLAISATEQPFKIDLTISNDGGDALPTCQWWNRGTRRFERKGCIVALDQEDSNMKCFCYHLTEFSSVAEEVVPPFETVDPVGDAALLLKIGDRPGALITFGCVFALWGILVLIGKWRDYSDMKKFRRDPAGYIARSEADQKARKSQSFPRLLKNTFFAKHIIASSICVKPYSRVSRTMTISSAMCFLLTCLVANAMFSGESKAAMKPGQLVIAGVLSALMGFPAALLFNWLFARTQRYGDSHVAPSPAAARAMSELVNASKVDSVVRDQVLMSEAAMKKIKERQTAVQVITQTAGMGGKLAVAKPTYTDDDDSFMPSSLPPVAAMVGPDGAPRRNPKSYKLPPISAAAAGVDSVDTSKASELELANIAAIKRAAAENADQEYAGSSSHRSVKAVTSPTGTQRSVALSEELEDEELPYSPSMKTIDEVARAHNAVSKAASIWLSRSRARNRMDAAVMGIPRFDDSTQVKRLPYRWVYITWAMLITYAFVCTYFALLYALKFDEPMMWGWFQGSGMSVAQETFVNSPVKISFVCCLFYCVAKLVGRNKDEKEAGALKDTDYWDWIIGVLAT
eukprot:CAMPEP_0114552788 /NCGR_PEP_ID=MMETSP0114-20121206/7307_1 /TAXON_ID=31324 /ORGANISM="Goniomonas sp, Strain m" /LENGTH=4347 /DNA_ID=CAMNT_0001737679 /DNA_START=49 /DNA_END=13092 /DNA_ORIENTATION=+